MLDLWIGGTDVINEMSPTLVMIERAGKTLRFTAVAAFIARLEAQCRPSQNANRQWRSELCHSIESKHSKA